MLPMVTLLYSLSVYLQRGNPIEQIDVRIDDKLNRIKNGHEFHGEDTIKDLIGYLILRLVVTKILDDEVTKKDEQTTENS